MAIDARHELTDELHLVLDLCSNEELEPIVNRLAAFGESYFKLSRRVSLHSPNHIAYVDLIGDEIYRLGITATGQVGHDRPSYANFLRAVWDKVGLGNKPERLEQLELGLINVFGKKSILAVNNEQKFHLIQDVCAEAEKAVGGILSSNCWAPFVNALIHVGYLRQKLVSEGKISAPQANKIVGASELFANNRNEQSAIILSSEDDQPFAIFREVVEPEKVVWNSFGQVDNVLKYLNLTMSVLEPLISAENLLSNGHYYRSDYELSLGQDGRPRGVAKGYSGMVPLAKVSVAALGGPAALAVAVKQMEEQRRWENIERSLIDIKTAVEGVSKFQKEERRAVLTGSLRYFQQIAPSVLSGELAGEILHGIERHEADLIKIQDHIAVDLKVQMALIRQIKNDAWLSAAKFMKALDDAISDLEVLQHEMRLCLRARACGFQLLSGFPGREAGKSARRNDIIEGIKFYGPDGPLGLELDAILREKAQLTSSLSNRLLILQRGFDMLSAVKQAEEEITKGMALLPDPTSERITIPLEFKVEGGSVVGYRTL